LYQAQLIEEQDKELYNNFLNVSLRPHFLQSYEWGELKSGTGWLPLRLLVTKDGVPVAAISLLKRVLPFFNRSILYAPRGPVIGKECDQAGEDFFWREVIKLGKQHGAILLKIDPDIHEPNEAALEWLAEIGFRPAGGDDGFGGVQPRYVFRMDITPSEEDLMAGMASKTRYNVRLASRKGVKVRAGENKDDLRIFYDILKETAERDRFLVRDFSYFDSMYDLFVEGGTARLFLAEYKEEIIAATLAFYCGDRAWYLYGASSNKRRNVMPNYLLQWEMIKWAKSMQCSVYDMRGVPPTEDPDDPLSGLYRFKKGFGGEFTEFIAEHDLCLSPVWYFLWKKLVPIYLKLSHRKKSKQVEME
jgi:lipid II:glycine glycyltransferase (peptidoglycan interpeptide bridge formation enzyme)